MDQHGQSQRQNPLPLPHPNHPLQQDEQSRLGQERQSASTSADRSRQSILPPPPPGAGSSTRLVGSTQQQYGPAESVQYGAGSTLQPEALEYAQSLAASEATRQQPHAYPQYGSNIMYEIAQPQPQTVQMAQSSYGQGSSLRQRPQSGSEELATQLGAPQYLLSGQPGSTGAVLTETAGHQFPSRYPQSQNYPTPGSSALHAFPADAMNLSQTPAYAPYPLQAQWASNVPAQSNEQAFDNYLTQIRNIFTLARDGYLRDTGGRLLEVSRYLLGNVEHLGLTRDDETLHDDRIRLWDEFNRAWLVTLQRQFDLTQQTTRGNQPLTPGQSIMDAQTLERISNELVRLCDSVERHGLVDYQMGVAEEDIVELCLRCISLLTSGTPSDVAGSAAGSTASPSRRR